MIQDVIEYLLVLRNREASRMNLMNFGKRKIEQISVKPLNEDKDKRPYSKTRQTSNIEELSNPYSEEVLQDVDEYPQDFLNRLNLINFDYRKRTEVPISDQSYVEMESPENYFWKLPSANGFNPDSKRKSMSIVRLRRNPPYINHYIRNYLIH